MRNTPHHAPPHRPRFHHFASVMTNISRSEDAEKTELTYRPIEAVYSGHQLRIIPSDPFYVPSPEIQDACLGLLIARFRKNEITSTLY